MKNIPFRHYHTLILIEEYSKQKTIPIDRFICHYFRANKALGSKDRAFIADTIYGLIRWQGLLDFLCSPPVTWEKKLALYLSNEWQRKKNNAPDNIQVSFPTILYTLLVKEYGKERADQLCLICNEVAPTAIRANSLKITRDELLKLLDQKYDVSPCSHSPLGIRFNKKINFFSLDEFSKGYFEVQDEGSQLLAKKVNAKPGQLVLDYCAGSGGKTLAIAAQMEQKGQIFLHDIREHALVEAKKRLKRAGIFNAQCILPSSPHLNTLKKKMDWVLVDAPCTGTGTLRRNPDMKWRFTEDTLPKLTGLQRHIFERALSFLKPDGRIVYSTCSLLAQENQQQVAHFLKTYNLKIEGEAFQTIPQSGEMDGFFGITLRSLSPLGN